MRLKMSLEKLKRYQNKNHIELIRDLPCMVCGSSPPSDPHHWKSRGSGGSDHLNNLVSLCHNDHVLFHSIGAKSFWDKYGDLIRKARRTHKLPPLIVKGEYDS